MKFYRENIRKKIKTFGNRTEYIISITSALESLQFCIKAIDLHFF